MPATLLGYWHLFVIFIDLDALLLFVVEGAVGGGATPRMNGNVCPGLAAAFLLSLVHILKLKQPLLIL